MACHLPTSLQLDNSMERSVWPRYTSVSVFLSCTGRGAMLRVLLTLLAVWLLSAWSSVCLADDGDVMEVFLERQVRIAAGAIVLSGAVAAMLTNNVYLAGIPAFVGAGLMFAGITDTCAMGLLIARMPWNQVRSTG